MKFDFLKSSYFLNNIKSWSCGFTSGCKSSSSSLSACGDGVKKDFPDGL